MVEGRRPAPRLVGAEEAGQVARLLHAFNVEFATPSPGVEILTARLRELLAGELTAAILAAPPPTAVALVTFRPNVWYPGPVALLDELYVIPERRGQGIGSAVMDMLLAFVAERGVSLVEINVDDGDVDAQRFYERHGFAATQPGSNEGASCWFRELT